MHYGKERTVVLKDGTRFTGKKVFSLEGLFEITYDVTKESEGFPVGTRIKIAAFAVSYIVYNK